MTHDDDVPENPDELIDEDDLVADIDDDGPAFEDVEVQDDDA